MTYVVWMMRSITHIWRRCVHWRTRPFARVCGILTLSKQVPCWIRTVCFVPEGLLKRGFAIADLNKFALQCLIWSEMLYFHPQAAADNMSKLPPESRKAAEKSLQARAEDDAKAAAMKSEAPKAANGSSNGIATMRLETQASTEASS